MSDQSTLKEKLQKQFEHWKTELEELNVQLTLGKAEAEDAFEKQKKRFGVWLDQAEEKLDQLEDKSEVYVEELKNRLKNLGENMFSSKPSNADEFQEQHQAMGAALTEVEEKLAAAREKGSEAAKSLGQDLENSLTSIRTQLDLFWLKFNLGKADAEDELEKQRKDASHHLEDLKKKMEGWETAAEDRWENFQGEMKEAFHHIRNAFKPKS